MERAGFFSLPEIPAQTCMIMCVWEVRKCDFHSFLPSLPLKIVTGKQ